MITKVASAALAMFFVCEIAYAEPAGVTEDVLDAFIKNVESATDWTRLKEDKGLVQAAEYDRIGKEFQSLSPKHARAAIILLEKGAMKKVRVGDQVASWGRIYVLLRYYIDVPEFEVSPRVKYFGGWDGVPEDGERVKILWPLTRGDDGAVTLRGRFRGYFGDEYDAIGEFDYLYSLYGSRQKLKP